MSSFPASFLSIHYSGNRLQRNRMRDPWDGFPLEWTDRRKHSSCGNDQRPPYFAFLHIPVHISGEDRCRTATATASAVDILFRCIDHRTTVIIYIRDHFSTHACILKQIPNDTFADKSQISCTYQVIMIQCSPCFLQMSQDRIHCRRSHCSSHLI